MPLLNLPQIDNKLKHLHDAYILLLTLVLIIVAWNQLRKFNNRSRADFLLRIDNRYGSKEIIKARAIIHGFYCLTRLNASNHETHIRKISDEIKKIGIKVEEADKFIHLLNFLDFLETIAYFANKNYITREDVSELLGGSMNYYYEIFSAWIYYRRHKYKDDSYYCQIQKYVASTKQKS